MNLPPYYLERVLPEIVEEVRVELGLEFLNFDYGYTPELNQKLDKKNATLPGRATKYPLIWLMLPFTIQRGGSFDWYGKTKVRILIIGSSAKMAYSPERFEKNYRGLLGEIGEEFLEILRGNEIIRTPFPGEVDFEETFRPFWGDGQKSITDDMIDVLEFSDLDITINNNLNC